VFRHPGTFLKRESTIEHLNLVRTPPTTQIDTWALGCVLYELASGEAAFCTRQDVLNYATSYQKLKLPWLGTSGWRGSRKDSLSEMLDRTLAASSFFRISVEKVEELIGKIIELEL